MPNQFLSDEFGDIEDYFVTDYWLIDNFVGDTLWGWGSDGEGELGTSDATTRSIPVTTSAGGNNWKQVSSGFRHMAAIKTDGSLWTWGRGAEGQLGTSDNTQRNTPVTTFAGQNTWKQVSCGDFHTTAIKTDGSLWVWGTGGDGRLGTNDATQRNTPVTTFAGGTTWKQVAGGQQNTVAIKTDGTLWIWGTNNGGRMGINDSNDFNGKNTPVTTFAGGTNWKQVDCGQFTTAIKTDGSLWTWGRNDHGQLGINVSTGDRRTPVTTFIGGTNWKQVSCFFFHMAAIKTDGSLWTCGRNDNGQLGINNNTQRNTPVTTFAGGNNWKQVDCGGWHTAAIKTDGSLWTWGWNSNSQLGINLGLFQDRNTPVTTFAGRNNWKSVSGGGYFTSAVQSGLNVDLS